jgi:hypothetical protein
MSEAEKATREELQKILDQAEKESPWILKREKKTNQ